MPMFESDYSLAWALYGLAALGCLLFWFRVTRWMWRWLREPLRLIAAVLLFTPTIVDPAKELFAPRRGHYCHGPACSRSATTPGERWRILRCTA